MSFTAAFLAIALLGGPPQSHGQEASHPQPGGQSSGTVSLDGLLRDLHNWPTDSGMPPEGVAPSFSERYGVVAQDFDLQSGESAPSFKEFHKVLGWNLTKGFFSADNLGPLLTGSAATMLALPFDEDLSAEFTTQFTTTESVKSFSDAGNIVGSPVTIAVATGALVLASPFTESQHFKSFAFTMAQAQILDSVLKYAIKFSVPRTRPNGDDDNSFPSGHTSGTFTAATVLTHYYGKKVGIPAYVVAALVGASRITKGKHYLSDVVFGATLGYIAGMTAIRGTERSTGQRHFSLHPSIGIDHMTVTAHLEF